MPEDPAALDAWLAAREAEVANLRPGAEKRIVWAGDAGQVTPLSVVFIHGFSAAAEEIRPVPDRVAEALGANLHFARLAGHGRDGVAMAEPTWCDWLDSTQEALEVARRIGERVLVMSCSTGGPLVALAMAEFGPESVIGSVFVSPNFALRSPLLRAVLGAPGIDVWGPRVLGRERSFAPHNPGHAAHWTTRYPTEAVFPMRDTLKAFAKLDLGQFQMPALAVISDDDQVVSPKAARDAMERWGGGGSVQVLRPGPDDDPNCHVIAGDILSPSQTEPAVQGVLDWARRENLHTFAKSP